MRCYTLIQLFFCCVVWIQTVLVPFQSFVTVAAWAPHVQVQRQPKTSQFQNSLRQQNNRKNIISKPHSCTQCYLFISKHSDGEQPRQHEDESRSNNNVDFVKSIRTIVATTTFLTVGWWMGSSSIPFLPTSTTFDNVNTMANAKEMASGSGSRVNKDPESLLRYGLPIQNKEVRKLQATLEDIKSNLASKRKIAAIDDTKKAKTILSNAGSVSAMKSSCRDAAICEQYIQSIETELDVPNLSLSLKEFQDASQGSDQERIALDKAYESQKKTVQLLSKLEEQMIPKGYVTPVPDEYSDMVQLQGRATVVMTVKKGTPSESFVLDGQSYPEAKLTIIIDGYAAPVTSGNFIDLVQKNFYTGMDIQRSDGFVIQTGDPIGEANGYVGTGGKAVGNGPHGERQIPLEIFVKGDKGPFYESTIEDEMRGGQATILPFSSYGAMGWAREEYEVNTGSSQFFWLLFDSDLTPAGKNVLDGRYPCFGYVVEGADFLTVIKEGDIIVSAKVTEGLENLKQPKA